MKKLFILLLAIAIGQFFVYSQYGYDRGMAPPSFDDAQVIRITYVNGEAFVMRSYEEGLEEATPNLPVFDRDVVGTTYGRLELYLGRFNHLRLDYDTEMEFEQAPVLGRTDMIVRVNRGGIYLFIQNLQSNRDIEIQTPDCGVFMLSNGRYRINVHEGAGSEIMVYQGLAEVNGTNQGIEIGSRFRANFLDGFLNQRPFRIMDNMMDDFLVWNVSRNRELNRFLRYQSRYMDPLYAYYEHELNVAGRWMYHRVTNGYVWIPNRVGPSWKPYFQGRWIRHPRYGMVWISYDSWGWHTHYYGRWHWDPSLGWYWVPGKQWSPAWVAWFWTDNYYGWCPLSIWNTPVIVINNRWDRNYRYQSGFPYHSSSLIVVEREHLWSSQIHKNVLSRNMLSTMGSSRLNFRGTPPAVKPTPRLVTVMDAKGRTLQYKKNGFLSTEKYNVEKMTPGKRPGEREIPVYRHAEQKSDKAFSQRVNRYSGSKDIKTAPARTRAEEPRITKPRYRPLSKQKSQEPEKESAVKKENDQKTRYLKEDKSKPDSHRPETRQTLRQESQEQKQVSTGSVKTTEKAGFQSDETKKIQTVQKDKPAKSATESKQQEQFQQKQKKPDEVKGARKMMTETEKTKSESVMKGQKQVQKTAAKSEETKDTQKKRAKKEKTKSESKKEKDKGEDKDKG